MPRGAALRRDGATRSLRRRRADVFDRCAARVKPAPFEYHAPATTVDAVGLLADLGDDVKVLAGGQSLVPMLALRLAASRTWSTSRGSPSCAGSSGTATCSGSGPATTDAEVERDPTSGGGAAAREGHAVHRPLPDSQPRHARRVDRPRRSGRRVPGRRARPRRRASRSPADAAPAESRRATSSAGSGPPRSSPTSSSCACASRSGPRGSGFAVEELARRHGDFAVAGATRRRRARRRRPHLALRHRARSAGFGARRPTAVEAEITGRPVSDVDRRRARAHGHGGARLDPGRRTRLGRLPRARARRGDGGPGVVGGGNGGAAWLRSRCT